METYGIVALFLIGGFLFILTTLLVGKLLRPKSPNIEKLSTYESGEEPLGNAMGVFNNRFYTVAITFLLFELEMIFLFPWAMVIMDKQLILETHGLWSKFVFVEGTIFIIILFVGLVYVWKTGGLDFEKPNVKVNNFISKVPKEMYESINNKYK